jgi:hypothetical protein
VPPKKVDADPTWRHKANYSRASAEDAAAERSRRDQLDAVDVIDADAVRAGPIMAPCPR